MDILHLWTIKSPSSRQLISRKGNGYQAIEIAEGVKAFKIVDKDININIKGILEDPLFQAN
jgi:hypothetical protein